MSETNALAEKLAMLMANEPLAENGARIVSEGGTPAPVAAILRAVDDTVLERCLEFDCGKSTLRIIAAGRRMRGILEVSPAQDAAIIGQVLSREEPENVKAAYDLIQNVCGDAMQMTVRGTPPEPFGQGGERGISAKGLTELWGVSMDVEPQPPMEQFLHMNAEAFSSVLHVRKGEIVTTAGDFKALQKIWSKQVEAFREAHRKTIRGEEGAQLICLDEAFEDGSSAAMAVYETEVALVAYQAERFGQMQSSWQRIFA